MAKKFSELVFYPNAKKKGQPEESGGTLDMKNGMPSAVREEKKSDGMEIKHKSGRTETAKVHITGSDYHIVKNKDGSQYTVDKKGNVLHGHGNTNEGYNDNRTGFAKREREDDEYHVPDPVGQTHKIGFSVSKEGGEKHSRTVTISNSTKSKEQATASARAHLEKQGYKIHEEVELEEATTGATKVVHTRTGADGAKYHIMQDSPTDYSVHREHNGKTKHIDTYGSLHRAKSVLDNEVKEETIFEDAYKDSEGHLDKADKAQRNKDMFSHHMHMADHHDSLSQWHDSKGRSDAAEKHANKAADHEERAHAIKQRLKEHAELEEATPTSMQVKQGIGIARDKRYAGGNMTGAVKAMDKVNKGLAQHPAVKKELQKQNEEAESHQSKTTMKHIPNPSPALKKAAKDIKPGVKGYRDRIAMLKAGGVKEETVTEAKDQKEYGYEGDMALNQLSTLTRCADMIKDMLKPDTDLPEWVQSKITLATDYIQTAADYMYSELKEELAESVSELNKHVSDFSKGVKSSAAKQSTYKRDGKPIHNMKHVETDSDHQKVFDHLKKMGYKKTGGYDSKPNEFTMHHNREEMTAKSDPVHHSSGVSAHVEKEHGGKTKVHFTHRNIKEQAPVAPVPDRKYIKGTPENKAYKATKKPINGMPTNKMKEEVDLEESGGPVVYKQGNDHIEKYGDDSFAVYKNGKKSKYYKTIDDAKSAINESKKEETMLNFTSFVEALKGNQHKIDKNKNGKVDDHDFKLLRKEETEAIEEARVNGREYASQGVMHPDHAKMDIHKPSNQDVDFYASKTGDKMQGKVLKNDGKEVHIKAHKELGDGKLHKFKVTANLPKSQNEEVEIEENAFDYKSKRTDASSGRYEIKRVDGRTIVTRKYNPDTGISTGTDDNEPAEKRGRGRPAGSKNRGSAK